MANEVEEIKKKLDIVAVISKYLPLKKRGRHYLACCPFHQEKTPSFTVSSELQIYKCFGCGKAGDMFSFLQEYERLEFPEALEQLAKMAGVTIEKTGHFDQTHSRHQLLYTINQEVARFYNYILLSHPLGKPALDYVVKRGVSLDIVKKFFLGFSPDNSQLLINYLNKKGYKTADLFATGTFGQSQYYRNQLYDRFSNRLVFPLFDYRSRVPGFSGRILPTSPNPNLAKYVNSPETEIYHKGQMLYGLNFAKDAIRQLSSVIVVEGEFDLISPYQIGVENIVAIKGTAFTPDQLQLLRRYTDTIILALDSDFAGNLAAKKSIESADNMGFDLKVIVLGDKYKDPDEAVRADPEFFKDCLKNAIPVWDFLIQSAVKNYGIDTIKGKKSVLEMVLPFLIKISNEVIRSDYYKKLAGLIGSSEEAVFKESVKYQVGSPLPSPVSTPVPVSPLVEIPSSQERLEEFLLILIFGARKPTSLAKKLASHLKNLSFVKFQQIIAQLSALDDFDPKTFQSLLPAEIQPSFQDIYLQATSLDLDSRHRQQEIKKIINHLESKAIKAKVAILATQIATLETSGDLEALALVETEYTQLLSDLSKIQNN